MSDMPEEIFAGMLKSGSTYWCSHPVEEVAKIVGAENAKAYPETKYIRADRNELALDAIESNLLDAEQAIEELQEKCRKLVTQLDKQYGTPCAQIRWQHEREELQAKNERLENALREARDWVKAPTILKIINEALQEKE